MNATEFKEKLKKRLAEILDSPKEPAGGWKELPISFDTALALVRSEHPHILVQTCRERDDCFVFEIGNLPDSNLALMFAPGPLPEAVRVNRITGRVYPPEPVYNRFDPGFRKDQVYIDITESESRGIVNSEASMLRQLLTTYELLETEEQHKPR